MKKVSTSCSIISLITLIGERVIENEHLYISCSTCRKEFNNLLCGVIYLSTIKGKLEFCSDECCRNYLKKNL